MKIHIGILGGGQLARMMAMAAIPLGIKVSCFDPLTSVCASDICTHVMGSYTDFDALDAFIKPCDIITYENENIPIATLNHITKQKPVFPDPKALTHLQDRLYEKQLCQKLKLQTTNYFDIESKDSLAQHLDNLPLIIKTRRMGYDGKGQYLIKSKSMLDEVKLPEVPLIAEEFVNFSDEVSLIAACNGQEIRYYPLTKNSHSAGILRLSEAPYQNSDLQHKAQNAAQKLISELGYVGVMAIEFFVVQNTLLINEIAPRVHNSGHWTIDAAVTSQFENHLRAICHLPLGDCSALTKCQMKNFIGYMPKVHELATNPRLKIHDYNKEPREGRKVGHATYLL